MARFQPLTWHASGGQTVAGPRCGRLREFIRLQRHPQIPPTSLALPTIEPLGADFIAQHDHGDKGR